MAGSALVTLAAPGLVSHLGGRWWFSFRIAPGDAFWLYLGVGALSLAWLGLGRELTRRPRPSLNQLRLVGLAWCLPLMLAPAVFSRDLYSYLAQGTILHLGFSPYHNAPIVLAHLGHQRVLDAVSPFWRHTTAPYGPLFLGLVSLMVGVIGSNLIAAVIILRLVEVGAAIVLAYFVPRLARALGADPARALWLVCLSPLVLLELIVPAHNDLLMAALMLAGVTLFIERRPLAGIALCGLAATIKLPAAAAIVFMAVVWAREQPTLVARIRRLCQAAATTGAVLLALSAVPGVGFSWLSSSLFSTPQRVRLAITPATSLGWTAARLLRDVGIVVSSRHVESVLGVVAFGLVGLTAVVLLWRVRRETMPRYLGLLLLAAAWGGPAAWPWYFVWGLALLAACREVQYLRMLPFLVVVPAFVVKADGVLALPLPSAPIVLAVYVAASGAAWYAWRRRRKGLSNRGVPDFARPASSALVES